MRWDDDRIYTHFVGEKQDGRKITIKNENEQFNSKIIT